MFMLHGRLGAKPGKRDDLLTIMSEAGESLPGNRLYVVAVDETDAEGVWATEIWESEQAHAASLRLDHVRERIARAMPLIETDGIRQQRLDARAGVPD
ncbi:antibiotic biosynthesis monooxygenase family protein [Cryptosporangium japonicum]|uniref:ABM domain-containing protein n=1 Tax=Cryptosporangium japonicum TaxID=80872 RepID=A0ABN0TKT7_9ACTN